MKLIFLRHGRTPANDALQYCGATDLPLSENGREILRGLRENCPPIDGFKVVSSGMLRTNETLKLLYDREPDAIDPGFAEIDFGSFEMHTHEEYQNDPDYIAWRSDTTGDVCMPGGETANHFRARVLEAFQRIDGDTMIVTHGGVIAVLMQHLFPEEQRLRWEWQPEWGHGYVIENGKYKYF